MKSKRITSRKSAALLRQQRQICVQMNRHFDEDACRAMRRGASK